MSHFPLPRPARLAVLASGRGSNLAALLDAFPEGDPVGAVVLVLSDKQRAGALRRAAERGVDARFVPFPDRASFEREALALLEQAGIDLVCLAGFMKILSPEFVARYRGRLLNIHPSLLPAFRGLDAQRQAIEAGARVSGCTVHFVDDGVDTGQVVAQAQVPVLPGDDVASLAARILVEEHRVYPEAVRAVLLGRAAERGVGA